MNVPASRTKSVVELSDGTSIPRLGFGVWRVRDDAAEKAVGRALDAGYRLIDTAAAYGNEAGVGRALRAAADRGVAREDVYVTTKVWYTDHGYDSALRAFDASMSRLGLQVLDLYLIHWPAPARGRFVDTWKALVYLQRQGRVRSIGVSNFHADHLDRLVSETGVSPVIDQIEMHPYLQQRPLRAELARRRIAVEAWSPLGGGDGLLADPVLAGIAARNGISPAQSVLAWHLAKGGVVIPKSVTPERIVENYAALDVTLPESDLAAIDGLDRGRRTGPDPAEFGND